MSEMYGPGDPTKITGLPLSKKDIVRKARQICQTAMPVDWEWGLLPLSTTNPPTQEVRDYAIRVGLPVTFTVINLLFSHFRPRIASPPFTQSGEALA
jgi:hypothetical protein